MSTDKETQVGRTYFEILESIKAQLGIELVESFNDMNITQENVRSIIQRINSVVDKNYSRGITALVESLKR